MRINLHYSLQFHYLLPIIFAAGNIKSCGPYILKIIQQYSSLAATLPHYLYFNGNFEDDEHKTRLATDMTVIENFITEDEEKKLLDELEPYMKNLKYERSHWDGAIEGYRETERLNWNEENTKIINRVRELAFGKGMQPLRYVHVLDLKEEGVIKPHIDSVRFCGSTIAGISLLSDSVMRLQHDKDKSKILDIFLKRRSLYIMSGVARYDYTHEILGNEESKFGDVVVKKTRRISVICRNEP